MHEFESTFPDWKLQVESAVYYPGRKGDVNSSGKQFTVYTTPGIDYVVKVPVLKRWLDGYRLVEQIAPECAVPFMQVTDLRLNIDRVKSVVPEAIVQTKVVDLIAEIGNIYRNKDIEKYINMARGYMTADRKMFGSGLFVPDPTFMNFGVNKNGEVRSLDLGSARTSFRDDEEYSNFARSRGNVHYTGYLALRAMEGDLGMSVRNSVLPSEEYLNIMQLPPLHPKATNMVDSINLQSGAEWDSDLSMFYAQIGHQEFINHAPDGAPFELNEYFIRGLPKSLLLKDGDNVF